MKAARRRLRLGREDRDGKGDGSVGSTERVRGTDQVTAIYVRQERRWALCHSDFEGVQTLHSTFIR